MKPNPLLRPLCCALAAAACLASAEEVAARVDVHVHLRAATQGGMLGRGPRSEPQAPRGSPAENLEQAAGLMLKRMDKLGVRQALVVLVPGQAPLEQEYESARRVVAKHSDRLRLMAGGAQLSPYLQGKAPGDVTDQDRRRFRALAKKILDDGAAGFGEMISYHLSMADHHSFQYAPADHPLFLELADIAAERDVPVDLHMEAVEKNRPMPDNLRRASKKNPERLEPTVPALERLLAHNRKARVVWQHIGWDNTGEMTPELVGRLLGTHENLFVALRVESRTQQVGGGPMPNRLVDAGGKLVPAWKDLIEKYAGRIVVGSDEFFFPVEAERPNQSFAQTWALLDGLSPELARKIGCENPKKVYRLK